MRFNISTISNRDFALLHTYRILKQPSDFLPPILRNNETSQILSRLGQKSEETYKEETLYFFPIEITLAEGYIPYLEFITTNQADSRNLAKLVYLDTETKGIYSLQPQFTADVEIRIYTAPSLAYLETTLSDYKEYLLQLQQAAKALAKQAEGISTGTSSISVQGQDGNLVQLGYAKDTLVAEDSGYTILASSKSKLVNPSQELLSMLPRSLTQNLEIEITDGAYRILDSFTGYTITISGNGSWFCRDVESTIRILSATEEKNFWYFNCSHVVLQAGTAASIRLGSLYVNNSLVLGVTGSVQTLTLVNRGVFTSQSMLISELQYLGPGCTAYINSTLRTTDLSSVLGELIIERNSPYSAFSRQREKLIYIGGQRIGFNFNQADAPIYPSYVESLDSDYIHIRTAEEE